jgi:hypothetical protein
MRICKKIETTLKTISRYSLAACLLVATFLLITGNVKARSKETPNKVQLLFLGSSNALLEPCG